ncbi:MAG: Verru_Chthon cassette protein C, partial [Verrucomicrobiaceae bacterium]
SYTCTIYRVARRQALRGFTLIEMLVATTLLMILMLLIMYVFNGVSAIDSRTRAKVDAFREARAGFEAMTRQISQGMLNTYWDYYDTSGKSRVATNTAFVPNTYGRQSELHFVAGPTKFGTTPLLSAVATLQSVTHGIFFQSPQGITNSSGVSANLPTLMNASGYYIEYTSDLLDRPKFLQSGTPLPPERWRFRLMEFVQGTENLQVYNTTKNSAASLGWFQTPLAITDPTKITLRSTRVVAENVIALVILPHRSPNDVVPQGSLNQLAPKYYYNSRDYVAKPADTLALLTRNQLPPMVQVTMVVIDERSAERLQNMITAPQTIANATNKLGLTTGLSGLFLQPSTQGDPALGSVSEKDQYLLDLKALETQLVALRLTYRIFSTDVSIMQAKWSE